MCEASARKALPRLAAELGLPLPPARAGPPRCRRRSGTGEALPLPRFTGTLQELGEARLRPALELAARQLCARLLEQEHPLGAGGGRAAA